ncbi:MAG: hypothetical protein QNL61_03185 [Crocinitomicaceae bacterium]
MSEPTLETNKVKITLLDNEIFRVLVKENVELEISDLDNNYFFFKEHVSAEKVPFLIIFGKGATTAKGAADTFNGMGSLKMKKKEALVLATLPHRIMANLYLRFSKPTHPTKIFSKEEDAIVWLKE